jgi:hypothetical protein
MNAKPFQKLTISKGVGARHIRFKRYAARGGDPFIQIGGHAVVNL